MTAWELVWTVCYVMFCTFYSLVSMYMTLIGCLIFCRLCEVQNFWSEYCSLYDVMGFLTKCLLVHLWAQENYDTFYCTNVA